MELMKAAAALPRAQRWAAAALTTTGSFIVELGDRISVVDRLGMAGLPSLIQALELPLLDADGLPQGLALELVLDDGPLRSGEHRGVVALFLRWFYCLIIGLLLLGRWHFRRRGFRR